MPGRRAPSRSLFASLPPELKSTIRAQGLIQASHGPSLESLQVKAELVAEALGGNADADAGPLELIRTQPRSESDGEDDEEDQETIMAAETVGEGISDMRPATGGTWKANGSSSGVDDFRGSRGAHTTAAPIAPAMNGSAGPSIRSIRSSISAVKRIRTEEPFDSASVPSGFSAKKRKGKMKALTSPYAGHPWDCTGLVPRYTHFSEVPEDIQKYFWQRHSLFAEYDELALLMDHTGWFSVTAQCIARHIAERCRCDVIVDAFCGVGGNAIEFAKTCERVIAIDNDLTRLRLARHNALQYGVADRIEFIHGSYIDWARSYAASMAAKEAIDVVFLSPPWGGVDYLTISSDPLPFPPTPDKPSAAPASAKAHAYPLSAILPVAGDELFRLTQALTPNIAYYLPRNVDVAQVAALAPALRGEGMGTGTGTGTGKTAQAKRQREWVEVEEEWIGERLKAVTAYYGGLVAEA